ncbi:MAG: DUF3857 domain-containing protein [Proteobacteria bacterium]|nr:DUF3857 domain-containing protein [Pseudomonadota bacterium]
MQNRLLLKAALALLFGSLLVAGGATVQAQMPEAHPQVREIQVAGEAFKTDPALPSWVEEMALPEVNTTEPVIIRLSDNQYRVDTQPIVHVRRALTVNSASALSQVGQLSIRFVPQYHRVTLHRVRVLRGAEVIDRTQTSTIRFLQRERNLEQGVYSGEVTASIVVEDLRVGDTVELDYSRAGANPVFDGRFIDSEAWDQPVPAQSRRVILSYPESRTIGWRMNGDSQPTRIEPKVSVKDGFRRLEFVETGIGKIIRELRTAPEFEVYRWLQFSEFASWHEVALWATHLFQNTAAPSDELLGIIAKLKTLPDDESRATAALEFVQTQIRYLSVSLGESSHRPTDPNTVLTRRYGDCKDKSFLLASILTALGIHAEPVLLEAGSRRPITSMLPSPLAFNHAIVKAVVKGEAYYLDPTRLGQSGSLKTMGQAHEGVSVLAATASTDGPTIIPAASATPNTWTEVVDLPKLDGDAKLTVHQVWHGLVAEQMRLVFDRVSRPELVKSLGQSYEQLYPGARLEGEPSIADDKATNTMSIDAVYVIPKMATERDGSWFLRYQPQNMKGTLALPPPDSTRKTPFGVSAFPTRVVYSFGAHLPEDVSGLTDPHADTVKNKHFTYSVAQSFRGNQFTSRIELTLLAPKVEAADYESYRASIEKALKINIGVVFVPKTWIKQNLAKGGQKRDFAQSVRDRLQDNIDKTGAAIKSGKLTGSDLAAAYCLKSQSLSDLGQKEQAIAEANAAIQASTSSHKCRGYAYFGAGEMDKAIADYTTAITLGETDVGVHQMRGLARLYSGKLEPAAEDLAKADETEDREAQAYTDIWLTIALKRLGRPLPDALKARAQEASRRKDWPRPALAMLAGLGGPADVIRAMEAKSGDEQRMVRAEGYFYLGAHDLFAGDKQKARAEFQRSREQGVVMYLEHMAAGFELAQLAKDPTLPAISQPARPESANQPAAKPKATAKSRKTKTGSASWTEDVWKR